MPDVEILELHHEKADAPSGTAIKTAIDHESRSRVQKQSRKRNPYGAAVQGPTGSVHSVRLPGKVAHQEVIFGGKSQTLTIRHDSIHGDSFMPGVCLACKNYGLRRTGLWIRAFYELSFHSALLVIQKFDLSHLIYIFAFWAILFSIDPPLIYKFLNP